MHSPVNDSKSANRSSSQTLLRDHQRCTWCTSHTNIASSRSQWFGIRVPPLTSIGTRPLANRVEGLFGCQQGAEVLVFLDKIWIIAVCVKVLAAGASQGCWRTLGTVPLAKGSGSNILALARESHNVLVPLPAKLRKKEMRQCGHDTRLREGAMAAE